MWTREARSSAVARRVVVTALGVSLLVARYAIAAVHATLVSAEPTSGAVLQASPPRVRLVFSEPVDAQLSAIVLVAADGRRTKLLVRGDARDVHAIMATVDSLANGTYRVVWRTVSADGHPVDGAFPFTIGASGPPVSPPPAQHTESEPSSHNAAGPGPSVAGAPLLAALARGVTAFCLMALAGLLIFVRGPLSALSPPRRRSIVALAFIGPVACAVHIFVWLLHTSPNHVVDPDWARAALGAPVGQVQLAQLALALLALWALVLARRAALARVLAFGALLVSAGIGHPAALHSLWAIPAKAVHVIAGAVWLGGLLTLIVSPVDSGDAPAFIETTRRVSGVALMAVCLLFVSGTAQTLLFLPTPMSVFHSAYGTIALLKLAGLGVLIAFGAYHRRRVLPRLTDLSAVPGFRRSLRAEVTVMSIVILLGGLLAYVAPPMAPS